MLYVLAQYSGNFVRNICQYLMNRYVSKTRGTRSKEVLLPFFFIYFFRGGDFDRLNDELTNQPLEKTTDVHEEVTRKLHIQYTC